MHIDGKTGVSRDDSPAPEAEGQGIEAGVHLIEQLQRLELAAQVGGLGVWDYDIALDRMTCDQRWYAIMGRDLSQPIVSVADFQSVIIPRIGNGPPKCRARRANCCPSARITA